MQIGYGERDCWRFDVRDRVKFLIYRWQATVSSNVVALPLGSQTLTIAASQFFPDFWRSSSTSSSRCIFLDGPESLSQLYIVWQAPLHLKSSWLVTIAWDTVEEQLYFQFHRLSSPTLTKSRVISKSRIISNTVKDNVEPESIQEKHRRFGKKRRRS